jgi:hypothetical protein
MNIIFPMVKTTMTAEAEAGSIVLLSRHGEAIFALATDQSTEEKGATLVLLNARLQSKPPVIFMSGWRSERCLQYEDQAEFEINIEDKFCDPSGSTWWETAGTIVSIGDQLFIRAVQSQDYGFERFHLINVRTGAVLTERPSNQMWTFGSWKLRIRGKDESHKISLCSFEISK